MCDYWLTGSHTARRHCDKPSDDDSAMLTGWLTAMVAGWLTDCMIVMVGDWLAGSLADYDGW